jgi:hypothetical protein
MHMPPAHMEVLANWHVAVCRRACREVGIYCGGSGHRVRIPWRADRPPGRRCEADQGAWPVVQQAEEQRGVRQVAQCLGPPVQVGLQVLLGYRVAAHRAQRQHVRAHPGEELTGPAQVVTFGSQHVSVSVRADGGERRVLWRHGSSPRGGAGWHKEPAAYQRVASATSHFAGVPGVVPRASTVRGFRGSSPGPAPCAGSAVRTAPT